MLIDINSEDRLVQQTFVDALNSQWDNLHQQTEKLRAARDMLLPRLMSGEVAV